MMFVFGDCSAYGEAIFLCLQTAAIAYLVLTYSRGTSTAVIFIAAYAAVLAYLLSPAAPMDLLWGLQAAVVPLIVVARVGAYTVFLGKGPGFI
jgi:mannose-P-dolichol utilization defect protein 1